MNDIKREKSNMELWAEEEIRIACERERRNGTPEGEWDYGVSCYENALKAFRSLMEDGHSGFSIAITLDILNKLVKGQVLTPIEDVDDVWDICIYPYNTDYTVYQCKRMSSLFKHVYKDGHVVYVDIDRFECVHFTDPNITWHNGHVDKIVGEILPVTMPYVPHTYTVACEEFLTDRKNGDYDTLGILYAYDDSGHHEAINRYFAETEKGWREIMLLEYEQRRREANARKEAEKEKGK